LPVGLGRFCSVPESLSAVHFALFLRPVYGTSTDDTSASDESDGEADGGQNATGPSRKNQQRLHTKTPRTYTLWLMNYGANGVRVVGKRWVLGEVAQLYSGDELVLGKGSDVRVRVLAGSDADAAVKQEGDAERPEETTSASLEQARVKTEQNEEQ